MAQVHVAHLSKSFPAENHPKQSAPVIHDMNFSIAEGEFVSIFGPNGSGKSTLLSLIAGLETPDSGEIRILSAHSEYTTPKIGFVFQNYNESMLPWRTVRGNVELALEHTVSSSSERKAIAMSFLDKVGLAHVAERYFYDLSGGMKQLVAICRAFAYEPDVLLLDEPFSALDFATTRKVEMDLLSVWSEKKKTALCISHDVDDAVFLADKVMVLSPRPAQIKGIITIDLPRPRTMAMFTSPEFFALRSQVLELFSL